MYLSIHDVSIELTVYRTSVPKLWSETIDAHRREVGDAILDTTAALVIEGGLRAVTMSQIAEQTGIGRATLYKYFPDVEAILVAWHTRHAALHLERLTAVRDRAGDPLQRLETVLTAWAQIVYGIAHQPHGAELSALLHREEHIADSELHKLMRDVLSDAAKAGSIRSDIAPDELATYCRHALNAARSLRSQAAVKRLVALTLAALRP
jgi:AcrR family transcriptional regulator